MEPLGCSFFLAPYSISERTFLGFCLRLIPLRRHTPDPWKVSKGLRDHVGFIRKPLRLSSPVSSRV